MKIGAFDQRQSKAANITHVRKKACEYDQETPHSHTEYQREEESQNTNSQNT